MPVAKQKNQGGKGAWFRVKGKNAANVGLRKGFRSGLEEANYAALVAMGVPDPMFEAIKIPYEIPASDHRYTPDFVLPNGIIVESKGKFEIADRKKHLLIKEQYPDLDIRFVFQRPNSPLYKGSKTTLAGWAEKHGYKWSAKLVPAAWLKEPGPEKSPWDVLGLKQPSPMRKGTPRNGNSRRSAGGHRRPQAALRARGAGREGNRILRGGKARPAGVPQAPAHRHGHPARQQVRPRSYRRVA